MTHDPAEKVNLSRVGDDPRSISQGIWGNVNVMPAIAHQFPIEVAPSDIDFRGHVNNASYLTWVQEAVLSHWRRLAPADAVAQHLWVALKHEITYLRPAFLDDPVIATVVLEKVHGARAFYETVIRRGEDVLAEVKSSWCCIDAETMRPTRMGKALVAHFLGEDR